MTESEWRAVPGWEGRYEVSDDGRVRSLAHKRVNSVGAHMNIPGKELNRPLGTEGYHRVFFSDGPVVKMQLVHRLVLSAFVGAPRPGMDACHNNGIRTDNRVENLRWGTRAENIADSITHGTHAQAARTHCVHGHAYDESNTIITAAGTRKCRACRTKNNQAAYARTLNRRAS